MSPNAQMPQPETRWSHRVYYGETDAMGVVYYANYLHWFEQARNQLLLDCGSSYSRIEAEGLYLPVSEANCTYIEPARFDEVIAVRCGIGDWKRASMCFVYRIINQSRENRLITRGWTRHACVDVNERMLRIPEWFRQLFC
jgi:acyl-CoA thioester hydrolase